MVKKAPSLTVQMATAPPETAERCPLFSLPESCFTYVKAWSPTPSRFPVSQTLDRDLSMIYLQGSEAWIIYKLLYPLLETYPPRS